MRNTRVLLLVALAATLLILATAGALAATSDPVPPEASLVPAWVVPADAAPYLEGYLADLAAEQSARESGSLAPAAANDPGEPLLLFVAPEDRDEAIERVMRGEDLSLVPAGDGFQAIAR